MFVYCELCGAMLVRDLPHTYATDTAVDGSVRYYCKFVAPCKVRQAQRAPVEPNAPVSIMVSGRRRGSRHAQRAMHDLICAIRRRRPETYGTPENGW